MLTMLIKLFAKPRESRYYWGYSHVREYDAIDNVYSDTIGFVYEGIFEDDEYSRID